ncbi:MAG: DUF1552 domain-containing protein [Deltaproteobacteria bacterium]|nr:DUF1552 domain-containing protein [Deltaproteobacteria bacterium]
MTRNHDHRPRVRRRAFLRGLAGSTLALPLLESVGPRTARAGGLDALPRRYVVMVGGTEQNYTVPSSTGADYTMPTGLASLAAVQDRITLVSGLQVPTPSGPNAAIPPGGRGHTLHGDIMPPLLTGYRTPMYAQYQDPTSDQVVAASFDAPTPFGSLQFRAQPHNYKGSNGGTGGVISARADGTNLTPQTSPRLAWEQLTLGVAPDDPAEAAAQLRHIARQRSVLDLVLEHGNHTKARVSQADAIRLEQHFDELRDLETRLDQLGGGGITGTCEPIADPGPDPTQSNHPSTEHGGTTGYSNETLRSEIFVDLVHMALACDLTRVATFQSTIEQCFMSTGPLWGVNLEVHDVTHVDFPERAQVWADIMSWQASFFGRLVAKLADSFEDGVPLLDNTVVVYTNTGGQSGHGSYDMTMAVAGPPQVLVRGQHIRAAGAMPCHVLQTAMQAVGVFDDFGEVPGIVPQLLV